MLLLAACAPAPRDAAITHRGTYVASDWSGRALRPATLRSGLVERQGEVAILEGDATLISGSGGSFGLVLDDTRNDPGRVMARYVSEVADVPGILVLFTTFDDRGAGGDAYFLPVWNDTAGTGLETIDQRAEFGAQRFEGLVNLKNLSRHDPEVLPLLAAHELAHRHVAYARLAPVPGSTIAPQILGRQLAHWHAALDTDASLLEGYEWIESGQGRFVAFAKNQRFSPLDRYLLGVLPADEVPPFFFIRGARTASGAQIPAEAQLAPGTIVFGDRIELTVEQVIAALGPRAPEPELHAVFALLTSPDERADDPAIVAQAASIDLLRVELEARWQVLTEARGTLCTRIDGCAAAEPDAGQADAGGGGEDEGCRCSTGARGSSRWPLVAILVLLACRRHAGRLARS